MNLSSYKAGNTLKTFIFLAALTGLFLVAGLLIGGTSGLLIALVLAGVMNLAMYWFSAPMALKMARAKEVSAEEEPELHQMAERLAGRAGIPKPKVYVTPDEQPNAFATGRNPKHAAIAVTRGIQRALAPRELEGVMAHEMAHIRNRDILIASIAAMVAGAISYLTYMLLFFGGDDDSPLGMIGALATFLLAPIAAGVIQMAISRQREYQADATGAQLMGDPIPLADALEGLQRTANAVPMKVNDAAAPMYIVNPLSSQARGRAGRVHKMFSTHPPTEERVARLRRMAGMASLELQTF